MILSRYKTNVFFDIILKKCKDDHYAKKRQTDNGFSGNKADYR